MRVCVNGAAGGGDTENCTQPWSCTNVGREDYPRVIIEYLMVKETDGCHAALLDSFLLITCSHDALDCDENRVCRQAPKISSS